MLSQCNPCLNLVTAHLFRWDMHLWSNECPPLLECGTQDYPNKTVTVELIVNWKAFYRFILLKRNSFASSHLYVCACYSYFSERVGLSSLLRCKTGVMNLLLWNLKKSSCLLMEIATCFCFSDKSSKIKDNSFYIKSIFTNRNFGRQTCHKFTTSVMCSGHLS